MYAVNVFGGMSRDLVHRIKECSRRAANQWQQHPALNFTTTTFGAYYAQRLALQVARRYSQVLWNKARKIANRNLDHASAIPLVPQSTWAEAQAHFVPADAHDDYQAPQFD